MDLTLSADESQLLGSIIDCLDGELPMSRLHEAEDRREFAERQRLRNLGELGWYGVSLPEAHGGAGLGLAEETLLFRELGRRLAPVSVLTAVLAGRSAAMAGESELAQAVLSGARPVALAVPEAPVEITAVSAQGPTRLFSTGAADLAVLVTPERALLLDISTATAKARPCLDRTTTMRSVDLGATKALASQDGDDLWVQGQLLLAAILSGQAEAARDMIAEYAKVRHTFGRPIGAYQAVRHPIAEMAARCEQARCLVLYAALAFDARRTDAAMQAAAARAVAQTAASRNDDANIQLHGGIGVTDDLDAHLYLKRTMLHANWLGGAKQQLKTVLAAPVGDI